jgi:hypothetical protein
MRGEFLGAKRSRLAAGDRRAALGLSRASERRPGGTYSVGRDRLDSRVVAARSRRPSEDGSSLLPPQAELVFRRRGRQARRRALEVAYERSALAVLS